MSSTLTFSPAGSLRTATAEGEDAPSAPPASSPPCRQSHATTGAFKVLRPRTVECGGTEGDTPRRWRRASNPGAGAGSPASQPLTGTRRRPRVTPLVGRRRAIRATDVDSRLWAATASSGSNRRRSRVHPARVSPLLSVAAVSWHVVSDTTCSRRPITCASVVSGSAQSWAPRSPCCRRRPNSRR